MYDVINICTYIRMLNLDPECTTRDIYVQNNNFVFKFYEYLVIYQTNEDIPFSRCAFHLHLIGLA